MIRKVLWMAGLLLIILSFSGMATARDAWYYLDLDGSKSWSGCPGLGGGADACFTGFGGYAGDIPIAGDWTGSGTKKIGIYRNGWYYLDLDGSRSWSGCPSLGGGTDACFTGFGGYPGDIPIVGDWTGNGIDKIGIYRNGWYYLDLDGSRSWSGCPGLGGGTDACFTGFGGLPGDIPIVGDWDGDGIDEIGIYRNGWYYLDQDGNRSWSGCPALGGGTDACFTGFGGLPGDIPIVGDWDGDGIDEIGIYRNGWYYLDLDGSRSWSGCPGLGGGTDACFTGFGGYPGDIPIVGAWTAGGVDKIGIYRSPILTSISITPDNQAVFMNGNQQLRAYGTYSDGIAAEITTQVSWASLQPQFATVNNTGLATGLSGGTATITASTGGVTGSTTLGVYPCVNGAGTWRTEELVNATACGEGYYYDYLTYGVTQNQCSIAVASGGVTRYGAITGTNISWTGSYPQEGGITTLTSLNLTMNAAGTYFSGYASWVWSGFGRSCSGTTAITGNR